MSKTKEMRPPDDVPPAAVPDGKRYLLAIGINTYPDKPLKNCRHDAETFVALLQERYGFLEEHTLTLYDEDATEKEIKRVFRELSEKLTNQDSLLIYYSGHGTHNEKLDVGYWIPSGLTHGDIDHFIEDEDVLKWIGRIKSHQTALIADACFGGSIWFGKAKFAGVREAHKPCRWGLTSGQLDLVPDGEPGAHSPFARVLLEILSNNNEALPFENLCDHVKQGVDALGKHLPLPHYGPLKGDKGGQFVFAPIVAIDPDEAAWHLALTKNTIPAYIDYRKNWKKYREEALAQMQALEDDASWHRNKNSPSGVEIYLDKYPEGRHVKEALELQQKYLDETLKIEAKARRDREAAEQKDRKAAEQQLQKLLDQYGMVYVEGGTYTMGDGSYSFNSKHKVTLDSFYIAQYPVTQQLWTDIMGSNPSRFKGDDSRPVETVSWDDAQAFIKKLNQKHPSAGFRLPTEAEWEYAARGGNNSKGYQYAGSNNIDEVAWYYDNSGNKTHPVGQKKSNELGLYDMSGNVWEWCQDWYASDYYQNSPTHNPAGPEQGGTRVLRGGSCFGISDSCRPSDRRRSTPDDRNFSNGFRLVLSPLQFSGGLSGPSREQQ